MIVLLAVVAASVVGAGEPESAPPRPNIIVFLADDLGYSDIGCYGGEIATPHLDRLAAEGLRFTQFYNAARCCPTRAALLTGLYPHRAGMGGMVATQKGGRDSVSPYQGYLNDRSATIAEVLGAAGYQTLMAGKWHVGENRPNWPTDRGFARYFGLISGACNYWKLDPGRKMALDGEPWTPPDDGSFYMTDAFSDHAAALVRECAAKEAPFFLYVAYTAPHWPLHAWPEDIDRYRERYRCGWEVIRRERHARQLAMGIVEERWPPSPPDARPWESLPEERRRDLALKMAVYAAMVDRMDQGIGKVLDALRASGEERQTLVLFLADNGGCHENPVRSEVPGTPPGPPESFLAYGRSWANASNTPFRRYKHWVHEGGIATPCIARWPGVVPEGVLSDEVGHVIDLLPTFMALAGASYPASRDGVVLAPLDGESLVAVLRGGRRAGDTPLFWEHEGNRAVRHGRFKLVATRGGPWELYDVVADRTECEDLAAAQPEVVEDLGELYRAWAAAVGVRSRR